MNEVEVKLVDETIAFTINRFGRMGVYMLPDERERIKTVVEALDDDAARIRFLISQLAQARITIHIEEVRQTWEEHAEKTGDLVPRQ